MGDGQEPEGTAARILDSAERLVQSRGFNGFSYADIAAELSLTKASLHYHYTSKAELGEALIDRYAKRFAAALEAIDAEGSGAFDKLARYADLYAQVLRQERICLCGMLASDYETLPSGMRAAVVRFFDLNQAWLERVLAQGQAEGVLHDQDSTSAGAQLIISTLEGAMLVARPYGDIARFEVAANSLLANLTTVRSMASRQGSLA